MSGPTQTPRQTASRTFPSVACRDPPGSELGGGWRGRCPHSGPCYSAPIIEHLDSEARLRRGAFGVVDTVAKRQRRVCSRIVSDMSPRFPAISPNCAVPRLHGQVALEGTLSARLRQDGSWPRARLTRSIVRGVHTGWMQSHLGPRPNHRTTK